VARKPLNHQLRFDDVLVADRLKRFPRQRTWFAHYRQVIVPGEVPVQARPGEFIRFCGEWHERIDHGGPARGGPGSLILMRERLKV
jgi:hypothetical protein